MEPTPNAQRLNQLVPKVAAVPPALLRILGASAANEAIVAFAIVERRTTQSLIGKKAGRLLVLTHTSVYLTDFEGNVTRMMRITELLAPLTIGRDGNATESIIFRVPNEPDVLVFFLGLRNGSGSTKEVQTLAAEVNVFNGGRDCSGAAFVARLKTLRDAYLPQQNFNITDVPAAQIEAAASLKAPRVVVPGAQAESSKDKVKALEAKVSARPPPTLPPASAAFAAPDGATDDDALLKAVLSGGDGDADSGGDNALTKQRNAALAERMSELLKENKQLRSLLETYDGDKRQSEDELLRLQEENRALTEQQSSLTARIDELTENQLSGRASAEDFSGLVQQLLQVQRQLTLERAERQDLVDAAVTEAKAEYNTILLAQQDELAAAKQRVKRLDEVFARMKRGIGAAATEGDGGQPTLAMRRSGEAGRAGAARRSPFAAGGTGSTDLSAVAQALFSYEEEASGLVGQHHAASLSLSSQRGPRDARSTTGPPGALSHATDATSLRYNLVLDT